MFGFGVAAAGVIGVSAALTVGGIHWQGFLGRLWEQQRYEIHKESQAYRDGMQRTLDDLMQEFRKAENVAARIGVKEAIRHQFSQTDVSRLPAYQQDFLRNEIGIY